MIQFFQWALVLTGGCFLLTFFLLLRNAFLPRYPYEVSLEAVGLSGEDLQFKSRDGTLLSGTLLLSGPKEATVILCHGVGANRFDLLDIARVLHQKGSFNVLLFDFRAHGRSQGRMTSFGYREQWDLLGALDTLDRRQDLSGPYGLYGVSMGGVVGMLVAAEDARIQSVFVDSPFSDLKEIISRHVERLYFLPRFPFAKMGHLSYHLLFLKDPAEISPVEAVHRISPRSFYLVNGAEDERMTPQEAKRLFERAHHPRHLWLVPGAGHLEGRSAASDQYDQALLQFFEQTLRGVAVSSSSRKE